MVVELGRGLNLSTLLGQGLQQGLAGTGDILTQLALQKRQQSQQVPGLQQLFPQFSEEQAQQFAQLPQQLQAQVLKEQLAAPREQAFAQALGELFGQAPVDQQQLEGALGSPAAPNEKAPISSTAFDQLKNPRLSQDQAEKIAKLKMQKMGFDAQESREAAKNARIEQQEINKQTEEFVKDTNKQAKAAIENDKRLARMSKLNQKGDLGKPLFNTIVKTVSNGLFGFGIDLTNWMTADAQEFDKLSADFVKNAKDYFGSRLTDADLKAFSRTIPNLYQSKEGRQRLIDNMLIFNEAAKIKQKTMRDIIRENNGKRPANLDELVDQRADKELDELAEKFVSQEVLAEPRSFSDKLLGSVGLSQ